MTVDRNIGLRDILQVGGLIVSMIVGGTLFYYTTSGSIDRLNISIDKLETSVQTIEDRVVELEKDESLQDYRLSDMEEKLDTIDRKVGTVLDLLTTPRTSPSAPF